MKYCEDCKWFGFELRSDGKCLRPITNAVYRKKQLKKEAIIERTSNHEDACGKDAKHWEEKTVPKTFMEKLGAVLNQE